MAPEKQRLVRVTIHAYRKEGISEEQFHEHWSNIHTAKVSEMLVKHGIVKYTQYHTPSWMRAEAQKHLKSMGEFTKTNMADYDGYVELVMPDVSCFERVRTDPLFEKIGVADEQEFADMANSRLTIGWEEVDIDHGEIVHGATSRKT